MNLEEREKHRQVIMKDPDWKETCMQLHTIVSYDANIFTYFWLLGMQSMKLVNEFTLKAMVPGPLSPLQ